MRLVARLARRAGRSPPSGCLRRAALRLAAAVGGEGVRAEQRAQRRRPRRPRRVVGRQREGGLLGTGQRPGGDARRPGAASRPSTARRRSGPRRGRPPGRPAPSRRPGRGAWSPRPRRRWRRGCPGRRPACRRTPGRRLRRPGRRPGPWRPSATPITSGVRAQRGGGGGAESQCSHGVVVPLPSRSCGAGPIGGPPRPPHAGVRTARPIPVPPFVGREPTPRGATRSRGGRLLAPGENRAQREPAVTRSPDSGSPGRGERGRRRSSAGRAGTVRKPSARAPARPIRGSSLLLREQQVARLPDRPVLGVGTVERLDLPPAGEERQQRAPQPQHRPGAEPRAAFEDRAEHREVQRDPLDARPRSARWISSMTMNSISPLSESRSRRIRSSDSPSAPHGTKLSSARGSPVAVVALDHHAAGRRPGRRAGPAPSRSRARSGRRASGRRARSSAAISCVRDVRVPPDPHRVAGPPHPVVRLPHAAHRAAVQGEVGGLDDRLVAELQRVQAVPGVDGAALLARAHHRRRPARARRPRPATPRSHPARPRGRRSGRRRPARPRRPPGRRWRPCRSATR